MSHFVCDGGCNGVSEHAGVCQTASCPKFNQPMQECDCQDGQHAEVLAKKQTAEHQAEQRQE